MPCIYLLNIIKDWLVITWFHSSDFQLRFVGNDDWSLALLITISPMHGLIIQVDIFLSSYSNV